MCGVGYRSVGRVRVARSRCRGPRRQIPTGRGFAPPGTHRGHVHKGPATRYKHAPRHIREIDSSNAQIEDYAGFEMHEQFMARLLRTYPRKTGFCNHTTAKADTNQNENMGLAARAAPATGKSETMPAADRIAITANSARRLAMYLERIPEQPADVRPGVLTHAVRGRVVASIVVS